MPLFEVVPNKSKDVAGDRHIIPLPKNSFTLPQRSYHLSALRQVSLHLLEFTLKCLDFFTTTAVAAVTCARTSWCCRAQTARICTRPNLTQGVLKGTNKKTIYVPSRQQKPTNRGTKAADLSDKFSSRIFTESVPKDWPRTGHKVTGKRLGTYVP